MKNYLFFLVPLIIINSSIQAQMFKILPPDNFNNLKFGDNVEISGDLIMINLYKMSLDNFREKRFSRFYSKQGNTIIPSYLFMGSSNPEELQELWPYVNTFTYSKLKSNYFLQISNNISYEGLGTLNLYSKSNGIFNKVDSIIFKYSTSPFLNYIIDYSLNKNWIITRCFNNNSNFVNPATYKIIDYFYRIEGDNIVLKDSLLYRDSLSLNEAPKLSRMIYSFMNEEFAYFSDNLDDKNGEDNGSVIVYKLINEKWTYFQTIFQPNPANGNSLFGLNLTASEDGRFLVVSSKKYQNKNKKAIYIFELVGDKYEFLQSIYPDWKGDQFKVAMIMNNYQLFVGDSYLGLNGPEQNFKGEIIHYIYKDNIWSLKSRIYPKNSDTNCRGFGFSISLEGETVVAGAVSDTTYGVRYYYPENGGTPTVSYNGAAYVFQVPARDTLDISICEGESYWFGEEALTMSGMYRDTLLASYGVDSVVVLNLSVLPPTESEVDTVLCQGQKMAVGDQTLGTAGYYTIPLKNIYGCDSIVSVSLSYAYLDMEAEVSPDFGCQNGKISLLLQGNNPPYSYLWSNGAITSENLSDLSPGLYAVTVTDRSGCHFTMNDLEVKEEKVFELPNAFIPTSQMEENQRFRPYLFPGFEETVTITEMDVFNRFGEKVYSGTDTMGWDGTFRGEPSPPGSYLFRILLSTPCGEEMRTGSLLLVR